VRFSNNQRQNNQRQVQGFTLIELLIAVTLGTALLTMVFGLFYSTKRTEQLNSASVELQASARNIFHLVRHSVEHAGYTTVVTSSQAKSQVFTATDKFAAGQVLRLADLAGQQTLLVRLQGDDQQPLRACSGSTIAPSNSTNPWVHYEFALANDQLNCRVFDAAGQQLEQLVIGTNIARFDVRLFTSNASGTQTQTNQSLAQTALAEGAQLQLIIKSERPVRAQVSDKTYSANGFADFQVSDQHLYHQISHYFIAQNR